MMAPSWTDGFCSSAFEKCSVNVSSNCIPLVGAGVLGIGPQKIGNPGPVEKQRITGWLKCRSEAILATMLRSGSMRLSVPQRYPNHAASPANSLDVDDPDSANRHRAARGSLCR